MLKKKCHILLPCALVAVTAVCAAAEWGPSVLVDRGSNLGLYPSMAAETRHDTGDVVLHISYYDAEEERLKYARVENGRTVAVWAPDRSSGTGKYSSLALDADGARHISYYDEQNGALKYMYHSAWKFYTITVDGKGAESDVGLYTSVAADSSRNPHISYYDRTGGDLKYIRREGDEWFAATVDAHGDVGRYSSLALDSEDLPHVAYYDESSGDLKYARFDGSGWLTETVDTGTDAGLFASIAIDSQDRPHIAYYNSVFGKFKYACHDGVTFKPCFVVLLDSLWMFQELGMHCSLALDAADRPHVTYYNDARAEIEYATLTLLLPPFSFWKREFPCRFSEEHLYSGPYNCLALDADGTPHVAFFSSVEKPAPVE